MTSTQSLQKLYLDVICEFIDKSGISHISTKYKGNDKSIKKYHINGEENPDIYDWIYGFSSCNNDAIVDV